MSLYGRPAGAAQSDFAAARAFEEEVGNWLGEYKIANLDSSTRLDYWVPGFYLDVKEKRQPLGKRWHLLDGVPETDLFVLDELSVRRAAEHFPHAYFLIRDCPTGRIFLARIDEVFSTTHARVNRRTSEQHRKGKWVLDLTNFRMLDDPPLELLPLVLNDQVETTWKQSPCLTEKEIPDV